MCPLEVATWRPAAVLVSHQWGGEGTGRFIVSEADLEEAKIEK